MGSGGSQIDLASCCSRGSEGRRRWEHPQEDQSPTLSHEGPESTTAQKNCIYSKLVSWINGLTPQEADYLERFKLIDVLKDIMVHLAQAAPADPTELLLALVASAAEELHSRGVVRNKQKRAELLSLLDTLCSDGDNTARVAANALLTKHGISPEDQSQLISWQRIGTILSSLETAWGFDREDTHKIIQLLKRGAFRAEKMPSNGSTACIAGAKEKRRNSMGHPASSGYGLTIALFMQLWPWVLRRVRQRYRPHGQTVLKRENFLRISHWKSVEECYELKAEVGSGQSGSVSLCVHKLTGNMRVLKTLAKSGLSKDLEAHELMREFQLLTSLDHPHIARVFEAFEDEESVHIAMEPILGGTLKKAIEARSTSVPELRESWARDVTRQMLDAVSYVHANGIVHKDLKPANVLLANAAVDAQVHVVVCDFGIAEHSVQLSTARFKRWGGTPSYMAPEVWKGDFSAKADIWSIGVILFEMLSGQLPYAGKTTMLLCREVIAPSPVDLTKITSEGGRDLCSHLLQKDETERPTAEEARAHVAEWMSSQEPQPTLLDPIPKNRASRSWASMSAETPVHRDSEVQGKDIEPIVAALASLGSRSHMDMCVMACIASQLNSTGLNYINAAFERWDTDRSGILNREEMAQALAELGVTGDVVEVLLRTLDTNGDGDIAYSEFVAGCLGMKRDQVVQHLKLAFTIFDLDKSGFIERHELERMLRPCKPKSENGGVQNLDAGAAERFLESLLPDGATVDEVLEEVDTSKDGRISFEEFRLYLLRNIGSG